MRSDSARLRRASLIRRSIWWEPFRVSLASFGPLTRLTHGRGSTTTNTNGDSCCRLRVTRGSTEEFMLGRMAEGSSMATLLVLRLHDR